MYLCSEQGWSDGEVGRYFKGKHRSTVLAARCKIRRLMERDSDVFHQVTELRRRLPARRCQITEPSVEGVNRSCEGLIRALQLVIKADLHSIATKQELLRDLENVPREPATAPLPPEQEIWPPEDEDDNFGFGPAIIDPPPWGGMPCE
jgi:hypothetical protein